MHKGKDQILKSFLGVAALSFLLIFGCKNADNSVVQPNTSGSTTDKTAMLELTDADSAVSSFMPNYNEDSEMNITSYDGVTIYPIHVWHRMALANRDFNVNVIGDSAFGTITSTFNGTLFIAASFDSTGGNRDTVIQKQFSTVVTRNLIFRKIDSTSDPRHNWRLEAVSLPKGGTQSQNVYVTKLTITLPNDSVIVITDPNQFYLSRGRHWWHTIPVIRNGDSVKVQVEIYSAYSDTDFVTLTHGADFQGRHRAKRLLKLISSTPSGNGFDKVYEQTYRVQQWPGIYHAVINAIPRQVIFDPNAEVESDSWGLLYAAIPRF